MAPSGSLIRCLWHVAPQLQGAKARLLGELGILLSFVLLPRILWCWLSFARAFLLGRLVLIPSEPK
jgi:hypothetical protein